MAKKTLIFLAPGFEEIEAATAIDILRRAEIDVTVAAVGDIKVTGSHGITLLADCRIQDAPHDFDACILPGGMPGAANLAASPQVSSTLKEMHSRGKIIAAICAAPALVLAPLGMLKGKNATCFAGMENHFSADTRFRPDPVVVDGNIITSRGPATALLFALAIVEKLAGPATCEQLRHATLLK